MMWAQHASVYWPRGNENVIMPPRVAPSLLFNVDGRLLYPLPSVLSVVTYANPTLYE